MSKPEDTSPQSHDAAAEQRSKHDRDVLAARLLVTCVVLVLPLTLMILLILYAVYRGETLHPDSHRSVACVLVADTPST